MAWTTPRTWSAGAVVTAAQMNAHVRDNLTALLPLDIVAWTGYTPTLTQSGSVTKTVTYAKYQQIGKLVKVHALLAVTGSGTGNNAITVTLPVTAATTGLFGGSFVWFNAGSNEWVGCCVIATTTTVTGRTSGAGGIALGVTWSADNAALANTDSIRIDFEYEAA